jgi:hypothetical protein
MGLPSVNIAFKEAGITAVARGDRGIVALILKDSTNNGLIKMDDVTEIPKTLSTYNQKQLSDAWIGYIKVPLQVIAYVEPITSIDYAEAMHALESEVWDYVAVPGIDSADITTISTWVKGLRDNKDIRIKVILPHATGDHEGIINLDTDDIIVGTSTYDAKDYCARIAGLIAGTPLKMSATYAVLPEVTDVPHMTKTEFNTAIDAGKFVLINDGKKVKVARAVNSLVTTTSDKGKDFKKIKLVDIMDQIHNDIYSTVEDSYIGKFPNDYDDKCLLITAINGYCDSLVADKLIDSSYSIYIDTDSNKVYLKAQGTDVSSMTIKQLKEANTGDSVLLAGKMTILDAIEDFALNIGI